MKIKVCGMKYKDNIAELVKLSPEFVGFNFYTRSKRFVGRDYNAGNVGLIPPKVKKIGVFVNSRRAYILKKVKQFGLDMVQLHGNESAELCRMLSESVKVIKAFGVDAGFDFDTLKKYEPYCDYFLFDTKTAGYGGSGKAFDWKMLRNYNSKRPFFLSGGIDLGDVRKISKLKSQIPGLYAIDVNSRFEIKPGLKDIDKLKKLKHEVRG